LQSYKITIIIFLGLLLSLISIHSQTHNAVENVIAEQQSLLSTNTTQPSSIVNDNSSEEQNKSKIIKAFGHFANNQINDGIVTWIQGGLWDLKINSNITNDESTTNVNNRNNSIINDNGNKANFIANFTMIKPDGSLSHNHNIKNFISDKVIVTDKDIVVMGIADIFSDSNTISEYKNVPLTIHLMGKKVLGLTMDVSKTEGHFASPNEMFGTLISGVGLDTSSSAAIDNSNQKTMMIHNDTATNDTIEEDSMTMMQH
jgi:hypothetical protein